jgi:tRNA(fMet)-specific endonuclease VapC
MLDTNVASDVIRSTVIDQRLIRIPIQSLCISTITEAELCYGLAKKPSATKLYKLVRAFLQHVDILPWDSEAAQSYAELRTLSESKGITLDDPDMFIAAHAHATGRTLATRDAALIRLRPWINVESWSGH